MIPIEAWACYVFFLLGCIILAVRLGHEEGEDE